MPMNYRYIAVAAFLLLLQIQSAAQTTVKGRVNNFTYDTLLALPGANVRNITSGHSTITNAHGYYSIEAKPKDRIVYSHTGFISDSITVETQMFISGYDAALVEKAAYLSGVTVIADYRRDSLRRRQEYAHIYDRQTGITGGHTPQGGAGIVISPISFFSKRSRQTRKLKKRLIKQEEEAYIDYVFSPGWVSELTGLKGDPLQQFMNKYRPAYEFCRQRTRAEMIIYISDCYKAFREKSK